MRSRSSVGAVLLVVSVVLLAGCEEPAGSSKDPRPRTHKPTPTATREAFSQHGLLLALKAAFHTDYPMINACSTGVPWDAVSCGAQLTAVNQIGQALKKGVHDKDADAPNAKELTDTAGTLNKTVGTIEELGCFGLGAPSPKTSRDALAGLCPDLANVALLSYLSLETSTDNH